MEARAGESGPRGELPPAARRNVDAENYRGTRRARAVATRGGLDVPAYSRVVRPARRFEEAYRAIGLWLQRRQQRHLAPNLDEHRRAAVRRAGPARPRPLRRATR